MKKENLKINTGIKFTIIAIVLIAVFCVALTPITLQNDNKSRRAYCTRRNRYARSIFLA